MPNIKVIALQTKTLCCKNEQNNLFFGQNWHAKKEHFPNEKKLVSTSEIGNPSATACCYSLPILFNFFAYLTSFVAIWDSLWAVMIRQKRFGGVARVLSLSESSFVMEHCATFCTQHHVVSHYSCWLIHLTFFQLFSVPIAMKCWRFPLSFESEGTFTGKKSTNDNSTFKTLSLSHNNNLTMRTVAICIGENTLKHGSTPCCKHERKCLVFKCWWNVGFFCF